MLTDPTMPGSNRYPPRRRLDDLLARRAPIPPPEGKCVFLSHRSADKPLARSVAAALAQVGVNYYLDEEDVELQLAQRIGNEAAVVRCIEDGLLHSTHLLGLITPRTRGSWWVPFEIGAARAHALSRGGEEPGAALAYLIDRHVADLPSYMSVSTILSAAPDFEDWLGSVGLTRYLNSTESLRNATSTHLSGVLAPAARPLPFT